MAFRRRGKGRKAHRAAKRAFRRVIRLPKRVIAKKYANTVGQIAFKSRRRGPSHGRRRGRFHRRRRY